MKKTVYMLLIIFLLAIGSCSVEMYNPLKGTWKMICSECKGNNDTLSDCTKIRNAYILFNDTCVSVLYEYRDSTTETYIAKYKRDWEKVDLKIIYHSNHEIIGDHYSWEAFVEGTKLTVRMFNKTNYPREVYQRID